MNEAQMRANDLSLIALRYAKGEATHAQVQKAFAEFEFRAFRHMAAHGITPEMEAENVFDAVHS